MSRPFAFSLVLVLAAAARGGEAEPQFTPGQETRVDDAKAGEGYYVVYVPSDYTPDRRWPAIVCYHGQGGKPTSWPFKEVTGGKGFVVVGVGYLDASPGRITLAQLDRRQEREGQLALAIVAEVGRRLSLDREALFVGGFSAGGWATSGIGEATPGAWAGLAILGAGRQKFEVPAANPRALRNKPIYIGAGDKDTNFPPAQKARDFYTKLGAKVTFEEYPGLAHAMKTDTTVLRDWLWANGPLRLVKPRLAAAREAERAGRLGRAYALYRDAAAVAPADEACLAAAAAAKVIADEAEKGLAVAEKAIADGRFEEASRLLARAATRLEGSDFGSRADELIKKLQADPKARSVTQEDTPKPPQPQAPADADRDCRVWLAMADNFLRANRPDLARPYLDKIIETHGETEWATKARERLAKMGK